MKTTHHLAGLCLLAAGLAAQDSPQQQPTAAGRLEALQQEAKQLRTAWQEENEAIRQAAADPANKGKSMPAMRMSPDVSPLIPKYQSAAADFAGTPDAPPFLMWLVKNASGKNKAIATESVEALITRHLDSPAMAEFGPMIPRLGYLVEPDQLAAVHTRLAQSKRVGLEGWLAFTQLNKTIEEAPVKSSEYTDAKATLLAKCEAAQDENLSKQVRSAIQSREAFGMGTTAPDIVGVDLDGVEFKLSDYKGKVIFLDFWGDW